MKRAYRDLGLGMLLVTSWLACVFGGCSSNGQTGTTTSAADLSEAAEVDYCAEEIRLDTSRQEWTWSLLLFDREFEVILKKGVVKAAARAGRIATEGEVRTLVASDARSGVIVEVNCQTDFVSRGEDFKGFVTGVAEVQASGPKGSTAQAAASAPDYFDQRKYPFRRN